MSPWEIGFAAYVLVTLAIIQWTVVGTHDEVRKQRERLDQIMDAWTRMRP